jgi:hypothetical protein
MTLLAYDLWYYHIRSEDGWLRATPIYYWGA